MATITQLRVAMTSMGPPGWGIEIRTMVTGAESVTERLWIEEQTRIWHGAIDAG